MDKNHLNQLTPRENILLYLLKKLTKEYKALLEFTRKNYPLKIVEILELSSIPGETRFAVQITNKNCILELKAAEIVSKGYNLTDFSDFHSKIIQQASLGKLSNFLKLTKETPNYKIAEKRFDKALDQYIFTIETKESLRFLRTAEELSSDKKLLTDMESDDVYDVAFTHGSTSILKEQKELKIAKKIK